VELGADINAQNNNGRTALIEALNRGDAAMALALIECGADPEIKDDRGLTAMEYIWRLKPSEKQKILGEMQK
jgi:ankyrin repeat protein